MKVERGGRPVRERQSGRHVHGRTVTLPLLTTMSEGQVLTDLDVEGLLKLSSDSSGETSATQKLGNIIMNVIEIHPQIHNVFTSASSFVEARVGGAATAAGCTVGIVERGLEDLRTGEVRVLAGEVRVLAGEVRVRAGDALLEGEDLVVRPGDALRVDTEESVLVVEALLMAALLLPPTELPVEAVATGIAVFVLVFVGTDSASFVGRPRVVRRGLSIFT
ncbi:hypothetical protein FF38_13404 [Lucilia cuprina]|uniref:Uncharacterized protein n=1 Tax=Lucilia cuprina TaxID=7375 RepID=A0A0L0CA15_LUCCU|nr:hypothetical protein FF38_11218 [Lucilia cuprina]KNC29092.1 hypothetical protein FF38_13404 [Lucilia cuprina]